jgi:hypothetical protein
MRRPKGIDPRRKAMMGGIQSGITEGSLGKLYQMSCEILSILTSMHLGIKRPRHSSECEVFSWAMKPNCSERSQRDLVTELKGESQTTPWVSKFKMRCNAEGVEHTRISASYSAGSLTDFYPKQMISQHWLRHAGLGEITSLRFISSLRYMRLFLFIGFRARSL